LAPGTDPADRAAIERLYDAASFDSRLNMVTRPLDAEAVRQLQEGIESGRPTVQTSALSLLAVALAQGAVPAGAPMDGVARASDVVASVADSSPSAESVRLLARRVLWHVRVAGIAAPADRAEFLAPHLDRWGGDSLYYNYASVDYLAELGPDGQRALEAFIAEASKRSMNEETLGRAKLGVRKIGLAKGLSTAAPGDAVRMLAAAAHTPTRRQRDVEFGKWVVGQLAARRPEADSQLRALGADEGVPDEVRATATFVLSNDGK
jgi:hypothetical protein